MKAIITLGRQLGSNGKLIGKALAEKLGIPFYDKALIARTAKESGLSEHLFDGIEEKPTHSLLYSLVMGVQSTKGLYYQYNDMINGDNIFKVQALSYHLCTEHNIILTCPESGKSLFK